MSRENYPQFVRVRASLNERLEQESEGKELNVYDVIMYAEINSSFLRAYYLSEDVPAQIPDTVTYRVLADGSLEYFADTLTEEDAHD